VHGVLTNSPHSGEMGNLTPSRAVSSEWFVLNIPEGVGPGEVFTAQCSYRGKDCVIGVPCPDAIYLGRVHRTIRLKMTREIAEGVLSANDEGVVPSCTELDVTIEVQSLLEPGVWYEVNGPESQLVPRPLCPGQEEGVVGQQFPPEDGVDAIMEPFRHPVEQVITLEYDRESQLTLPWELNRLAPLTWSQLGAPSPTNDYDEDPKFESLVNVPHQSLGVADAASKDSHVSECDDSEEEVLASKRPATSAPDVSPPAKRSRSLELHAISASRQSDAATLTLSLGEEEEDKDEATDDDVDGKYQLEEAIPPENDGASQNRLEEEEEEEEEVCYLCGKTPCEWVDHGLPALEEIKKKFYIDNAAIDGFVLEILSGKHVPNNHMRFTCYKCFTYEKFGHLGRGNRVKLPICVESKIKELFPSLDGNYTNFTAE
jgi:hypothetical protein